MNVNFVDTTLRDGAQSLWAMWMRTGVMEQVAPDLDAAGLAAIELPLNPTFFKKRIRDMKEDPWEMLRLMARLMPRTPKAFMAGATINSFEPPPRSIVKLFYQRVAATGAFNRAQLMANTMDQRTRDFPWLVPLYRELGIQVVIALAYQIRSRRAIPTPTMRS